MKSLLFLSALLLTLAARAADAPAALPKSEPGTSLVPLASLVGGLWIGDIPVLEGKVPLKIELRFSWTENHQAIRFDSAFVTKDQRKPYTSGLYAWDGAKGKIVIFYVGDGGEVVEGTVTPEGKTLVNELTLTEQSGKTSPIQVRLTKVGNDEFENAIFLMKNNKWEPFVTVKYTRQP